jgi:hypothetical protein
MSNVVRVAVFAWALVWIGTAPAAAQSPERLSGSAVFESYAFDDGYGVEDLAQMTVPIVLQTSFGSRAALVVSTGYVSVALDSRAENVPNQHVHGPLDTEARLDLSVIPDRLVSFIAATLPTGRQTVVDDQLSVMVALANDAIGFTAPSLGSGGSVSGGFSIALPLGRMAMGAAANAAYAFAYEPLLSQRVSLSPGAEVRVRLGLEGPLASRTYLRLAGSMAARQKDEVGGVTTHGLGRRVIGYVTLEQGIGPLLLSLYVFDVHRGSPQLEPTALGAAILPKGNLLAGGATITMALGTATSFVPSVEYRVAAAAPSVSESGLERQASSIRAGAELRRRIGPSLSISLRGQGIIGEVLQSATYFDFQGYRVGLTVGMTP